MQTILGAGGAIANHLAKELRTYTSDIRLVSRNPKKIDDRNILFAADITDSASVQKAVEGSEIVYLTAGLQYNLKVWQAQWPKIMRNVIDACTANGAKLVFFDNIYMISKDHLNPITENSPIDPPSEKGKVRAQLDRMVLEAVEKGKLNAIIARSADFYGPLKDRSILIEMVYNNLAKGKKPQWLAKTHFRHSFTYTPDAAKGTAILGNTPDAYNQVWNLPTHPNAFTIEDWAKLFAKEMGKPLNGFQVVPVWMLKLIGLFVPVMAEFPEMCYQYDRDYVFDSSKFTKRFGLEATAPETGIRETVKALQQG